MPGQNPEPAPSAKIRRIRESDLELVRALRLRSLATDPLAFGSTWAREHAFDESTWRTRVRNGATSSDQWTWVAELAPGLLIGMVGAAVEGTEVHVYAMWVDPARRGNGTGGQLLDELLSWVAVHHPNKPVVLSVNPSQPAAVQLYRSRGFLPSGRVDPLGHTSGAVAHEMRRPSRSGETAPPG